VSESSFLGDPEVPEAGALEQSRPVLLPD